ncbi:hypothetical protein GW17_00003934 [Ensete ventricosum]|nr:hypothetical protein GW17_00003934 [Ensete ventricosum]
MEKERALLVWKQIMELFVLNFSLIVHHILSPTFSSCCDHVVVLVAKFIVLKAEAPLGILKGTTYHTLLLVLPMLWFKEHWKLKESCLRSYQWRHALQ